MKAGGAIFELKKGSLKCNLEMDRNGIFSTGELAMDFYVDTDTEIHVQARSFRYSKNNTVVQTDITPKGRQSGAKLGKASTMALDPFLNALSLERPKSPSRHPEISIDGDFSYRQGQLGVADGGRDTITAFFDRCIGQAHDRHSWQALRKIDFHFNRVSIYSQNRSTVNECYQLPLRLPQLNEVFQIWYSD